jgi:hypothetical protein
MTADDSSTFEETVSYGLWTFREIRIYMSPHCLAILYGSHKLNIKVTTFAGNNGNHEHLKAILVASGIRKV